MSHTPESDTSELESAAKRALSGIVEFVEAVGAGGTAMVFRGVRKSDNAQVAVKVLRPELASGLAGERFLREIAIESRLQHEGIVPVTSWGRADGLVYAVMEWESRETLRDRIDRDGQLPIDDAIRITLQLAAALAHAHEHGVVHRDVKPENVLLPEGRARLLDFGIARALTEVAGDRLTDSGIAVGTPAYMSPEQASGDARLDARSDQYSLACCLYEMLAGDPPFVGRTAQAVIARHLSEAAPSIRIVRGKVPRSVEDAVRRALAKSPADRYQSISEFAQALKYAMTPAGQAEAVRRSPERRRRVRYAISTAVVALGAYALWPSDRPLDDNKIVIFPLADARAPVEADAGWSVAIAIESSLEHALPLRGLDGWTLLAPATRADPRQLGVSDASRFARKSGARYFVTGAIAQMGDSVTVTLRLHDASADSLLAQESARSLAAGAVVPQLGIRATRALLSRLLAQGRRIDVTLLEDRSPSAIALWLNGERAYRRSEFQNALTLLERAVGEDSLLAVAAIRGAQAASWDTDLGRANGLLNAASAHAELLPARYVPLIAGLKAYVRGDADSARAALSAALALDPGWIEPMMALGETYFHFSPNVDAADSLAIALFDAVARADTNFAPPLAHLAEIAIVNGQLRRADQLIARMKRLQPDRGPPARLAQMRTCVANSRNAKWDAWAADSVWTVLFAGRVLAVGGAQPECAEGAFRAVLRAKNVLAGNSWGAFLGLQGLLLAEGRNTELRALIDSAVKAGQSKARLVYIVDAMAGAPTMDAGDSTAAFARTLFGDDYGKSGPQTRWVLSLWHASRGDTAMVVKIGTALDSIARTSGARHAQLVSAAMAVHVALARRDTTRALDLLRRLHTTAGRDSLQWEIFEPLAVERMLLARILAARGQSAEAIRVARTFDQYESVMNVSFIGASLRFRDSVSRAAGLRIGSDVADRIRKLDAQSRRAAKK